MGKGQQIVKTHINAHKDGNAWLKHRNKRGNHPFFSDIRLSLLHHPIATIDIFGLLTIAFIGLIAVILLVKFTEKTHTGLDYKLANESITDIQIASAKACRDGSSSIKVSTPDNYAYIIRTCGELSCKGETCKDENIPGKEFVIESNLREKIYKKFCKTDTDNILVICTLRFTTKYDWGIVGRIAGWKHIGVDKSSCFKNYCGIPYYSDHLLPGKARYLINFYENDDKIKIVVKNAV